MKHIGSGYCPYTKEGERGFLRAAKGVLGTMPPFVLLAVLGSAIAVSAVLVLYMLVRRWL